MIFETLSLEYFLAGKTLPWNKQRNPVVVSINPAEIVSVPITRQHAPVGYFNLKG